MQRLLRLVLVAAVLVAAVAAGCGSDASDKPAAGADNVDPVNDKLAQIKARGTLVEYLRPTTRRSR